MRRNEFSTKAQILEESLLRVTTEQEKSYGRFSKPPALLVENVREAQSCGRCCFGLSHAEFVWAHSLADTGQLQNCACKRIKDTTSKC